METAFFGEDAAQVVFHFAEANDVGFIVSGTIGLVGSRGLCWEVSVTHKLLQEAKCLCLVVKKGRVVRVTPSNSTKWLNASWRRFSLVDYRIGESDMIDVPLDA